MGLKAEELKREFPLGDRGEGRLRLAAALIAGGRGPHRRDALRRRLLAGADAATAVLVSVSLGLFYDSLGVALWSIAALPVWLVVAKLNGLYDRDHRALRHLTADELPSLVLWALVGTALLAGFLQLTPSHGLSLGSALIAFVVAMAAGVVSRGLARSAWRHATAPERALVLGQGPLADATRRKLELFRDIHVEVVHEHDASVATALASGDGLDELERVILAAQTIGESDIAALVEACREHAVKLSLIPPARGMFGTAVTLRHIADLPVIDYNTWDPSRSTLLLKRVVDIVLSVVGLVVTAPLLFLIALAIRLDGGPAIFRQRRAGLYGEPFVMFKFRTMVPNAEERLAEVVGPLEELPTPMLSKTKNDPRVTRVGRLLRRTSLDELPQLWNVLRGEMSLVGPRPERPDLVARYEPEHRVRLEVKPGVTGPMQVYGRGDLTFPERLAVERDYVENLSLGRDFRIMALTIPGVLRGKGAF